MKNLLWKNLEKTRGTKIPIAQSWQKKMVCIPKSQPQDCVDNPIWLLYPKLKTFFWIWCQVYFSMNMFFCFFLKDEPLETTVGNLSVCFLTCLILNNRKLVFFLPNQFIIYIESINLILVGKPQQFLVRATFSSFSHPSHLGILVLRLLC